MSQIDRVGVVGCGLMGSGIAEVCARAGLDVVVREVNQGALDAGRKRIEGSLDRAVRAGKLPEAEHDDALTRLRYTTDFGEFADRQLVVEAVIENEAEKLEVFRGIDKAVEAEDAILASNTSSIPVMKLAMATNRPASVLGLHFFNPVPVMKLLESVQGERTDGMVVTACRAVGARMGKEVVVVRDAPGFATSRLGIALALEAIRMVEEGVASAEEIDRAIELGYGHPMGPLKLTDHVGLDVRLAIAEHLHAELGERFRPPQLLRRMVRAGKLGKKSGEGFYKY